MTAAGRALPAAESGPGKKNSRASCVCACACVCARVCASQLMMLSGQRIEVFCLASFLFKVQLDLFSSKGAFSVAF